MRELGADPALVETIGFAVEADCVLAGLLGGEPLRPGLERQAVVELVRWPLTRPGTELASHGPAARPSQRGTGLLEPASDPAPPAAAVLAEAGAA
jgi:hypothetical protein